MGEERKRDREREETVAHNLLPLFFRKSGLQSLPQRSSSLSTVCTRPLSQGCMNVYEQKRERVYHVCMSKMGKRVRGLEMYDF